MSNTVKDPEVEEGFKLWYGQNSNFPVSNAYNDPEFYRNIKRSFDKTQNINASDIETTEKSINNAKAQEKGNALLQPTYLMANEHKTYIDNINQNSASEYPALNPLLCGVAQGLQGLTLNWADENNGILNGVKSLATASHGGTNATSIFKRNYINERDKTRNYLSTCSVQYPEISKYAHDIGQINSQIALLKAFGPMGLFAVPLAHWGKSEGNFRTQMYDVSNNITNDITKETIKKLMGINPISPVLDYYLDEGMSYLMK